MRRAILISLLAALLQTGVSAQTETHVDFFAGVDLSYRDIHWNKLMEVLVNVTPGVRMRLGDSWQLAGQVIVPVYNDYGEYYSKVRLGIVSVAKEFQFGSNHLKLSGGMFSGERYGLDAKWMLPVNSWLAFDAQLGLTGRWSPQLGEGSLPDRLTGWGGARIWLDRWATEGRIRAGRFIYADWGVIGEGYRHFKHCSVGAFGQWGNKGGLGAGFKVIVLLPPYKRTDRTVNVRPASSFLLSHNVMADSYSLRMYNTDPEENEREGVFRKAEWGPYSLGR